MARVLYSASISEFKGSVKGNTFQRNSSGTIVKARNLQRFSPSAEQNNSQNRLGLTCSLWSSTSPAQKEDWNGNALTSTRYDFYGNAKRLSGFQWFQLCNNNLLQCGEPVSLNCPSPFTPEAVPPVVSFVNSSNFGIQFSSPLELVNASIFIIASAPIQTTLLSSRIPKRIIRILQYDTFEVVNLTTEWNAIYGLNYVSLYGSSKFVIQICVYIISHVNGVSSQYTYVPAFVPNV